MMIILSFDWSGCLQLLWFSSSLLILMLEVEMIRSVVETIWSWGMVADPAHPSSWSTRDKELIRMVTCVADRCPVSPILAPTVSSYHSDLMIKLLSLEDSSSPTLSWPMVVEDQFSWLQEHQSQSSSLQTTPILLHLIQSVSGQCWLLPVREYTWTLITWMWSHREGETLSSISDLVLVQIFWCCVWLSMISVADVAV